MSGWSHTRRWAPFLVWGVLACGPAFAGPSGAVALPAAILGRAYLLDLPVRGGQGDTEWTLEGDLPPGLSFGTSGRIEGTPRAIGTWDFRLTVADQAGARIGPFALQLEVVPPPAPPSAALTIDQRALPPAYVGIPFAFPLQAGGGTPPYSWSAEGAPSWLTLDGEVLRGMPPGVGAVNLIVAVRDAAAAETRDTLEVAVGMPPFVEPVGLAREPLPDAVVGEVFAARLRPVGGVPPYAFEPESGGLGLSLDPHGRLGGTARRAGTWRFTPRGHDALGTRIEGPPLEVRIRNPGGHRRSGPGVLPAFVFGVASASIVALLLRRRPGATKGEPDVEDDSPRRRTSA